MKPEMPNAAPCYVENGVTIHRGGCGECPTPVEKLVTAVQKFLKHDGGPGSEDYDASAIYHARRSMQSAFGFRCPKCGETLPHLYDENCAAARGPDIRARIFAQDICRELYDRFAMGGWEPIDAHNWLIDQLHEYSGGAKRL
jgi:hypothetical protein